MVAATGEGEGVLGSGYRLERRQEREAGHLPIMALKRMDSAMGRHVPTADSLVDHDRDMGQWVMLPGKSATGKHRNDWGVTGSRINEAGWVA